MLITTLSSKYQISVPKKIREELNIKPGQQFIFITKGNCIELVPKIDIKDVRGILKGANVKQVRDRSDRL